MDLEMIETQEHKNALHGPQLVPNAMLGAITQELVANATPVSIGVTQTTDQGSVRNRKEVMSTKQKTGVTPFKRRTRISTPNSQQLPLAPTIIMSTILKD